MLRPFSGSMRSGRNTADDNSCNRAELFTLFNRRLLIGFFHFRFPQFEFPQRKNH